MIGQSGSCLDHQVPSTLSLAALAGMPVVTTASPASPASAAARPPRRLLGRFGRQVAVPTMLGRRTRNLLIIVTTIRSIGQAEEAGFTHPSKRGHGLRPA